MREHLARAHAVVIGGLFNDRGLACNAVDRCQTCSIRAIGQVFVRGRCATSVFFANVSIDCPFDYRAISIRSLFSNCIVTRLGRFSFMLN